MNKSIITVLTALIISICAKGQLYTTSNYSPEDLCTDILNWSAIQVVNVEYTGYMDAIGYFNGEITNIGIDKGLLLTTGTIHNTDSGKSRQGPHGPNDLPGAGMDNNQPGYGLLNGLTSGITYNAAVLEIDFIALESELEFTYVFGSEEYPEYVCSAYNDVFGIFISGPGISGIQNIAKIPETNTYVAINTVNSGLVGSNGTLSNCMNADPDWQSYTSYFVSNGNGNQSPFNGSQYYVQYDGFTVPLTAQTNLEIGEQYKLTIAIADVGDGIYDSGLFIQAESIETVALNNTNSKDNDFLVYPNPTNGEFKLKVTNNNFSHYLVTDASGRAVLEGELVKNEFVHTFQLTEKGLYFVQLISNYNTSIQRLVVY